MARDTEGEEYQMVQLLYDHLEWDGWKPVSSQMVRCRHCGWARVAPQVWPFKHLLSIGAEHLQVHGILYKDP